METRAKRETLWATKACDICGEGRDLSALGTRINQVATQHYIFEITMDDVICESCGFVFAHGIPEKEFLFDYYKDDHTLRSDYVSIPEDFDGATRLGTIREHLLEGSSILEMGASTGNFCEELRRNGYQATGLDPLESDRRHNVLKAFVGANLTGDRSTPVGVFDAVVGYYVLEHVVNARAWIDEAKTYLRHDGLLILEVPNFERWPVESLTEVHFLHFTPFHLGKLLVDMGFEVVAIDTRQASRYFGFQVVARLRDTRSIGARDSSILPYDAEGRRFVGLGKQKYREAQEFNEAEDQRRQALAEEIRERIRASLPRDAKVYFWGANRLATRTALLLAETGSTDMYIVDNLATKIGTRHAGFQRPICAPIFQKRDPSHRMFVPCSPAWNWQILEQIQQMALHDITIIDGVNWKPEGNAFR